MKRRFNNFARQEIAKFIMGGPSPMPHPRQFSEAVERMRNEDLTSLMIILAYCGYLGYCYEKDIEPSLTIEQVSIHVNADEASSIWMDFLEAEGMFLEFSERKMDTSGGDVRYEDILSFAFGEIGLMPWQFYRMTMAEYGLMCNGYFFKRWRPNELTRLILYAIAKVFKGKKETIGNIESFMPLPTDKASAKTLDNEQIKRMWAVAKNM
jgi:hypothetical protein